MLKIFIYQTTCYLIFRFLDNLLIFKIRQYDQQASSLKHHQQIWVMKLPFPVSSWLLYHFILSY